eukprot:6711561-Pyramimonas_sp.AAC.1
MCSPPSRSASPCLALDRLQQPCQLCVIDVLPLWHPDIRRTVCSLAVVRCQCKLVELTPMCTRMAIDNFLLTE